MGTILKRKGMAKHYLFSQRLLYHDRASLIDQGEDPD